MSEIRILDPATEETSNTPEEGDGITTSNGAKPAVNGVDAATAQPRALDTETSSPAVEVLPPIDKSLDGLPPNVKVDRTRISVGLGGLSVQRTHMSTESAETDAPILTDESDALADLTDATTSMKQAGISSDSTHVNTQLFTRFLVGLAIYGADEILARLQKYDEDIRQNPEEYDLSDHLLARLGETEESVDALVRYWAIGTLLWGQREAFNLTHRTFQASINVSHVVLRGTNKGTNNLLLRPFRRPVERLVGSLTGGAKARIEEGRQVETHDRVLAQRTLDDIVGGVIDYISENPELADLISEQGLGLASNIMDTGRQVGASADTAVEKMVRKIFRRKPRQEVEQSPLVGKPQNMYDPTADAYYAERNMESKED